jgi:hypothetical protein
MVHLKDAKLLNVPPHDCEPMSHPTTIRHAFWDGLRTFYRKIRRAVGTSEEHSGKALVVAEPIEDVRSALGSHYFAPNWEFSYYERGEDLNLARVEFEPQVVRDHEFIWWQTHVRGWKQDGGSVRLRAHYELEPTESDQDHINGIGVDIAHGTDEVAAVLDDEGLAYERHDDVPAGGAQ